MAERLTVDQKAVGSTPIAHPKDSLFRESFSYRKQPRFPNDEPLSFVQRVLMLLILA